MRTSVMLSLMVVTTFFIPTLGITESVLSRVYLVAEGITVELDFGNETIQTYTGLNGTNVLDVTESIVDVEKEWYGDLVFVTSIAGVSNNPENGLFWQYWVNDVLGSVAANNYNLNENDVVSWRRLPPEMNTTNSTTSQGVDFSLLVWAGILSVLGLGFLGFLFLIKNRR